MLVNCDLVRWLLKDLLNVTSRLQLHRRILNLQQKPEFLICSREVDWYEVISRRPLHWWVSYVNHALFESTALLYLLAP